MITPDSQPFDPVKFNFMRLPDFTFPGVEGVYEFKNHPDVDGKENFLRLNYYMTKDGDFVTIWRGLLEALFTESILTKDGTNPSVLPPDFDLYTAYNEHLFRGHIASEVAAQYILAALRIEHYSNISFPQIFRVDSQYGLTCEILERPVAVSP